MLCNNCGIENEEGREVCRSCGLRIAPAARETIVHSMVEAKVLYAGFWKRAAAILIDIVLLIFVSFIVGNIFFMVTGSYEGLERASNIFGILLYWLYFALMESSEAQATIGKRVLGIIVTDKNGKRLTFLQGLRKTLWKDRKLHHSRCRLYHGGIYSKETDAPRYDVRLFCC